MDYKVGSLAELISGNKTSDKTKIIQKTFKSIKKERVVEPVPDLLSKEKNPKKTKVKAIKKKLSADKEPKTHETTLDNKKSLKNKAKKRNSNDNSNNLPDSNDNGKSFKNKAKKESQMIIHTAWQIVMMINHLLKSKN